jgi:hypothetical protein
MSLGLVAAFAAAGCASRVQAEPEPATPPLHIEDQSADAPPPPPPSAPPSDAPTAAPPPTSPSPPSPVLAAPMAPAPSAPAEPPVPASAPAAPPSTAWTQEYPAGRWVYASGYGWMWVPANTATTASEGVPYAYLYTPSYGWTWYVSPWGPGPYRYGAWVRRPWHPVGWRGAWVARPGVVIRLGGPRPRYYHYREHVGRRRW